MFLVIPTGHSDAVVRRIPWVTIVIAALCLIVQLWSSLGTSDEQIDQVLRERDAVERKILYDYELLDAPNRQQREFLDAFHDGEDGDPDDELRDEYQAARQAGRALDKRNPIFMLGYRPSEGGIVRMVTCAFVHGGWIHLLGNLLFLYLVGCNLEDRWTRGGFIALYLLGAFVSSLSYALVHPGSSVVLVGASGAVAAAMGAFLVVMGTAQIRFFYLLWVFIHLRTGSFHAKAYVALPLWFAMQLLSAWGESAGAGDGVAYSAHVGGFLFGAAVAFGMKRTGWDEKLNERGDEVVFDAARGIGTATAAAAATMVERVRNEPLSLELVAEVNRYLQEAARKGHSREILELQDVVAGRGDMTLDDRSLMIIIQAAAELNESELVVDMARYLMETYPQSSFIPRALWDTAAVQRRAGRADLADKTLGNLIRLFPDDPFAHQARQQRGAQS